MTEVVARHPRTGVQAADHYRRGALAGRRACDDLDDVVEWLREGAFYAESDRVREISARLRAAVEESLLFTMDPLSKHDEGWRP